MDRITDITAMNLANPNFVRDEFVKNYLTQMGVELTQNKVVSTFRKAYNAAVAGLNSVKIVNADQFPDSEHFAIFGIRALDGIHAALNSTDWMASISNGIAKNGLFSADNGGTTEIKDMPLTAFQSGTNDPQAGVLLLPKPLFWKGQTQLTITLSFPTVVATANYNLRFELIGIKLI